MKNPFNFKRFVFIAIRLAHEASEGERLQDILKVSDKLSKSLNYPNVNKDLVVKHTLDLTAKIADHEQNVRSILARLAGINEDMEDMNDEGY